ncbi:MAG: hypothetical protein AAF594_15915, partial [Bacteroidota bacterium]
LTLLVAVGGCDGIAPDGDADGPALEVFEGGTIGVSLLPSGNVRLGLPDGLFTGPHVRYNATVRVFTPRIIGRDNRSVEELWAFVCERMEMIPQEVDYGTLPEGCSELTSPRAIRPGQPAEVYVAAVRVNALGFRNGRDDTATFRINDPEAVRDVERTGDEVTVSWSPALASAHGRPIQLWVFPAVPVETVAGPGWGYSNDAVRSVLCFLPNLPNVTSLSTGGGPDGCSISGAGEPVEDGTYFALVTFVDDDRRTLTFASRFEW